MEKKYIKFEIVEQNGEEYIFIPIMEWNLASSTDFDNMILKKVKMGQLANPNPTKGEEQR